MATRFGESKPKEELNAYCQHVLKIMRGMPKEADWKKHQEIFQKATFYLAKGLNWNSKSMAKTGEAEKVIKHVIDYDWPVYVDLLRLAMGKHAESDDESSTSGESSQDENQLGSDIAEFKHNLELTLKDADEIILVEQRAKQELIKAINKQNDSHRILEAKVKELEMQMKKAALENSDSLKKCSDNLQDLMSEVTAMDTNMRDLGGAATAVETDLVIAETSQDEESEVDDNIMELPIGQLYKANKGDQYPMAYNLALQTFIREDQMVKRECDIGIFWKIVQKLAAPEVVEYLLVHEALDTLGDVKIANAIFKQVLPPLATEDSKARRLQAADVRRLLQNVNNTIMLTLNPGDVSLAKVAGLAKQMGLQAYDMWGRKSKIFDLSTTLLKTVALKNVTNEKVMEELQHAVPGYLKISSKKIEFPYAVKNDRAVYRLYSSSQSMRWEEWMGKRTMEIKAKNFVDFNVYRRDPTYQTDVTNVFSIKKVGSVKEMENRNVNVNKKRKSQDDTISGMRKNYYK